MCATLRPYHLLIYFCKKMHTLSIIILQHNSPKETQHCLESLQKAWLPEKTEIIVIDNGGKNANEKISKEAYKHLKVKFFDIPNKGYPNGNNFGLKHADGEYIAFINPDIIVPHDTIKTLLRYFDKHPQVGIVAPRLVYPDGSVQDNYRVFPRFFDLIIKRTAVLRKLFLGRMRQYLMWDKEPTVNEPVDWVTGAFEIIKRECLEKVGNHDERYFLFMSDVAICRSAWDNGYEVHFVGEAQALHNDERLSSGGFMAFFKKKTLRIHVKDALKYYLTYFGKSLPAKSPSVDHIIKKDRLLKARVLAGTSALTKLKGKLQKQNPVVSIYRAVIEGSKKYEQPIVFFATGVIGLVKNEKGEIGLMKTWRHIPLRFNKKNTFPIFPDVADLGMWSYECPRGGIEKKDTSPEEAVKRELQEEIGLNPKAILSLKFLGNITGNTAIDIYHHKCFEVVVPNNFKFKTEETIETIKEFTFFTPEELKKLIENKELFCGLSQAAILQAVLK